MQVDFLPAAALTKEAQEAAKARQIAMAKLTRRVPVDIEGDPGEMQLLFKNTYKTNGGFMFDLVVTTSLLTPPPPPTSLFACIPYPGLPPSF